MVRPCNGPRPVLSTLSSYLSPAQEICMERTSECPRCALQQELEQRFLPYLLKVLLTLQNVTLNEMREIYLLQKGVPLGMKLYAIHKDSCLAKPVQVYVHT